MKGYIEQRVVENGKIIIETGKTIRDVAKLQHVSKSTVHKDITERLPRVDFELYKRCRVVLDSNLEERHLRGGYATRTKYEKLERERINGR